uniref:Uncharacterized protein n=1 Tax=Zea mays TaxID=4577 RepID=C0PKE7_MAIZE|nr:unknown [Zea mays]
MDPSTKLSSHEIPYSFNAPFTTGHASCRYFSRYWGKRVEKELTSSMPPSFQAGSNLSIFQRSMLGSSSHGLGLSCFPFRRQFFPSAGAAAAFASSSDMAEKKEGLLSAGPSRNWRRKRRR